MQNCDIIIPVHNGFDYLQKCLASVTSHTDLKNNRLIIIDDKSVDGRIAPFIEDFISSTNHNIVFITNKENLGFTKSVNIGMRFSDNDVLLLNSDTEVTKGWLKKIQNCAYSRVNIATVTPLSNNATIASVPKFCLPNSLPEGYKLDEFQSLIDKTAYKDYNEIPTGIGFCLYIKREVLNIVGFFDEISYGTGYGEEEDFCYRCIQYGYRHILCDDVYIFHAESKSFLDKKQKIIDTRIKLLTQKYPDQKNITNNFLANNPLGYIQKNIDYNLCLNNNRPNLLIIIHGWFYDPGFIAGTGYHVQDLIKSLKHKYNFHVFVPYSTNKYRLYSYWDNEENMLEFSISEPKFYCFYNIEYHNILFDIVKMFKIDLIHIHHMLNHFFDIIDIIKEGNIPCLISLHDFYSICPSINKIDYNGEYCGLSIEKHCGHCLQIKELDISIDAWRRLWKQLFHCAESIIVPSESTKNEIMLDYPELNINVIEHGVEIEKKSQLLNIDSDEIFNIAFLGVILKHKGEELISGITDYLDENIVPHIFGVIKNQNIFANKRIKIHGSYKREELSGLLTANNIKLVCIFSIWPETFSYTFIESVANSIPVLAIDLGNVGYKIKTNDLGWLVENGIEPEEIAGTVKNIFSNKQGYRDICESVKKYRIKTLAEMAVDYDSIYSIYPRRQNSIFYTQKLKNCIKQNFLHDLDLRKNKNQNENTILSVKKCVLYFNTGNGYLDNETYKYSFIGNEVNLSCSVPKNTVLIRLDPVKNSCCIVSDLKIVSQGKTIKYEPINGYENENGEIVFIDFNPEIKIKETVNYLDIYYKITILPDISDSKILEKYINISQERDLLRYLKDGLENDRNTLKIERDGLINSRSWRITKPLRQLGVVVRQNKLLYLFIKGLLSLKRNGIKGTGKKVINYFKSRKFTSFDINTFSYESTYQGNIDFSEYKPKIKAIAFYLPQFHRIPENDKWWGNGFTEWTNTRAAKRRFKSHYQPREPHEDIGHYNLTNIETIKWQVKLARQHGIYGFCFYLYWFSGKRLLEKPLDMFLEHSEIDINFCLCWANENWTRTWDGQENKLLIKQNYSDDDPYRFIEDIQKYITDKRYIKINGTPIILVYNPGNIPNVRDTFLKWKEHANKTGIGKIAIMICKTFGHTAKTLHIEDLVDGLVDFPPHSIPPIGAKDIYLAKKTANIYDYKELVSEIKKEFEIENGLYKTERTPFYFTCMMDWDNSARKQNGWSTFAGFSLRSFFDWTSLLVSKSLQSLIDPVIFINAWNEWGEGTYLEPDKKYGYANINTISKAICGLPFHTCDFKKVDNEFMHSERTKICVQVHVYYIDLLDEIITNLNHIPFPFNCYISTDTDEKVKIIQENFRQKCKTVKKVFVGQFENRGRDVGPFLEQIGNNINEYDFILHIHTKKSLTSDGYGDAWRKYLYHHLLGNRENIYHIFENFLSKENLGLIFPEVYPPVLPQMIWGTDIQQGKKNVYDFLKKAGIKTSLNDMPEFTAGDMFWARTKAVKKAFTARITQSDFPDENNQKDMTLAHAIERSWIYITKSEGYTFKYIMNNDGSPVI